MSALCRIRQFAAMPLPFLVRILIPAKLNLKSVSVLIVVTSIICSVDLPSQFSPTYLIMDHGFIVFVSEWKQECYDIKSQSRQMTWGWRCLTCSMDNVEKCPINARREGRGGGGGVMLELTDA